MKFAENFKNDDANSIIRRYPGSYRDATGTTDNPKAWPLRGYNTLRTDCPIFDPTVNNRLEIVMGFSGEVNVGTIGAKIDMFGLQFSSVKNGTANEITIMGHNIGVMQPNSTLNIIVDVVNGNETVLIVVLDGVVVLSPTLFQFRFTNFIGGAYNNSFVLGLPTFLEYVVIEFDTVKGTRLSTPTFKEAEIELTSAGEWTYSDVGIIADTDTDDPARLDPNISTVAESDTLTLTADKGANLYISGNSEADRAQLTVNGSTYGVHGVQQSFPKILVPESGLIELGANMHVTDPICNDDGVCFYGELTGAEFATFAELSTLCGMNAGTLMTGAEINKYLKFTVDGEEVIIPKVSVRYNVSWNDIYLNGLVYGMPGPGPHPSLLGPRDQNKIITIKGKQYRVMLMRGRDSEPCLNTNGYDIITSQRSEFSRIFYPIVSNDPNITSYTGKKLANYTMEELMLNTGNGRYVWCQEVSTNAATRAYRGYYGPSFTIVNTATHTNSYSGWRPCLKPI